MHMRPVCFAVRLLWEEHTVAFQFSRKFLLFELQWILSKFWQDLLFDSLHFYLAVRETQKSATVPWLEKFTWVIWIYFFPLAESLSYNWLSDLDAYTRLFPTFFHLHSFVQTYVMKDNNKQWLWHWQIHYVKTVNNCGKCLWRMLIMVKATKYVNYCQTTMHAFQSSSGWKQMFELGVIGCCSRYYLWEVPSPSAVGS